MQSQLANDILNLIDTNTNRVIDMIVTEYGSGNQPFTREDCENLINLPSKLAKTTTVPKRNKVAELEVKADKNPVAKVEKNTRVKDHTENTSDEYCVARVWGSAKDGTAGLPTNQCKKKATSGCFCTMHFKKNAEQSPWHLGLITDDPPETDHKGKTIKWVGSVRSKKQKVLPKVVEEVVHEPEVVVETEVESDVESDVDVKQEPEVVAETEQEPEVKSDVVAKSDLQSEPEVEPEVIETEPEVVVNDADTELESEDESDEDESDQDESDEVESDQDESDEDGPVTESKVIDGKDYEVDAENNVYEKDEDDDWVKVGVFIDGELVKND